MGKKSREKKERRAIKSCNITLHEVTDNGELYKVQEYHPNGTEHMDYETFMNMRLVVLSHHKKIEDILTKLVYNFPERRFAIAVGKDYIPGDHDIPVFVYPAFSEKELNTAKDLVNAV